MDSITYAQKTWRTEPLAGRSGQAYIGVHKDQKIFIKINDSPLTAKLAAERISPRLLNSETTSIIQDKITIQEWIDGSLLDKDQMANKDVISLVRQVHHSDSVRAAFVAIQSEAFSPIDFLNSYLNNRPEVLQQWRFLVDIVDFLLDALDDDFYDVEVVTCHGDLNHNNFIMSMDDHLYLVDWENARLADPLSDITWLLCQYFKFENWDKWLDIYQFDKEDTTYYKRLWWYGLMNYLLLIKSYYEDNRPDKASALLPEIKVLYEIALQDKRQKDLMRKESIIHEITS